jgi:hypothetical protein
METKGTQGIQDAQDIQDTQEDRDTGAEDSGQDRAAHGATNDVGWDDSPPRRPDAASTEDDGAGRWDDAATDPVRGEDEGADFERAADDEPDAERSADDRTDQERGDLERADLERADLDRADAEGMYVEPTDIRRPNADTTVIDADLVAGEAAGVSPIEAGIPEPGLTPGARADGAATPGPESPSDTADDDEPLIDPAREERFLERWSQARIGFVDDPQAAVTEAGALLDEIVAAQRAALETRRSRMEDQCQGSDADTEDLRMAMRGYGRLVSMLLSTTA